MTSQIDHGGSRPDVNHSRIVIVDDHPLFRVALVQILDAPSDLEVVGEAPDGRQALELCRRLQPDLVLMDVSMPVMDGLEAARTIKDEFPKTSVLMLTAHAEHRLLMEAVKAGAAGYLLKGCHPDHLLDAVRRILRGEAHLDQELAIQVIRDLADGHMQESAQASSVPPDKFRRQPLLSQPLTDRELEVLKLLAQGRTNREIARELRVSVGTVKAYVHRIIAKLEVSDRTQAAVKATELGILTPG
jgi:DNA-binding NarL/FixJ family response regulator